MYRERAHEEQKACLFGSYVAATRLVTASPGERAVLCPEVQDFAFDAMTRRYCERKTEMNI